MLLPFISIKYLPLFLYIQICRKNLQDKFYSNVFHSLQCLEDDIKTLQSNMDNILETGSRLIRDGEPAFALRTRGELDALHERWKRVTGLAGDQRVNLAEAYQRCQTLKGMGRRLHCLCSSIGSEYIVCNAQI